MTQLNSSETEAKSMQPVLRQMSDRADFGVYFLANNKGIQWAYTFLASFRKSNPNLPLTLIPYNNEYDQISTLSQRFNFDVLESESYERLDALNDLAWPSQNNRMFRKFAAFWGIYDNFFYLDTDIIVTSDLRRLAVAAGKNHLDFAYFEAEKEHINHVYRPGAFRDKMISEYHTNGFNAGAWWARRHLFSLEEISQRVQETDNVRDQLVNSGDQPYLNYCCDVSQAKSERFSDFVPNLMPLTQVNTIRGEWNGNRFIQTDGEWSGREISMVHFAGVGTPNAGMPNYRFYLANRAEVRGTFNTQLWNIRWQGQWLKYRLLSRFKSQVIRSPE